MTTSCEFTQKIIADSLLFVGSTRINSRFANFTSCLEWINGKPAIKNVNSKKTWWQRLVHSVSYFQEKHDITLNFEHDEEGFSLRISSDVRGTNIAKQCDRRKLSHILRNYISGDYANQWHSGGRSSYFADTLHQSPRVNKGILNGKVSEYAWRFIHRARTNTLPILAHAGNKDKKDHLCRRCGKQEETMMHALQECLLNLSAYKDRHDACLEEIYNLVDRPDWITAKDQTCSWIKGSKERVDLMLTDVEKLSIHLIDIKCPIDTIKNFANTDENNLTKYAKLQGEIKDAKPSFSVDLKTCIIGSLGTVPVSTVQIFKGLRIPDKTAGWCLLRCAYSNIEMSARIWRLHSTGILI